MSNLNIEQAFCNAASILIEDSVQKAGYDKTIEAVIISCDDITQGKHTVSYQGTTFVAYAPFAMEYDKDTVVYVLIAENNQNRRKFILGSPYKAAEIGGGGEPWSVIKERVVQLINESLDKYKDTVQEISNNQWEELYKPEIEEVYQKKLTQGKNIVIDENNVISALSESEQIIDDDNINIDTTWSSVKINDVFQDKLIPGENIVIDENNVISATTQIARLEHSLTIGPHVFDGSEDIYVPVYNGEMEDDNINISVLNDTPQTMTLLKEDNETFIMTLVNNENEMQMNNENTLFQMN